MKKVTLDSLYESKKSIDIAIKAIERALGKETTNFEEYICKRYIEIQSVSGLAKEINEEGYRLEGRKYIGKDISKLIKESVKDRSDSIICKVANILASYNNTLRNGRTSFKNVMDKFEGLVRNDED